ncbi:hypothetical protein [Calothrix sp. PCC 6303]|uniref:hypothetical protein n=1 Tax=Calothrix sp. PCC 6303 TaxID=1170562 RepID=UPI001EF01B8C|nr:hypothetical protein [Calothrix sp. PCC 6303]
MLTSRLRSMLKLSEAEVLTYILNIKPYLLAWITYLIPRSLEFFYLRIYCLQIAQMFAR